MLAGLCVCWCFLSGDAGGVWIVREYSGGSSGDAVVGGVERRRIAPRRTAPHGTAPRAASASPAASSLAPLVRQPSHGIGAAAVVVTRAAATARARLVVEASMRMFRYA